MEFYVSDVSYKNKQSNLNVGVRYKKPNKTLTQETGNLASKWIFYCGMDYYREQNNMIKILNNVFIVPVIALATVILFYFLLLKKTNNPIAFKRISRIILSLAFILNFMWEMAQMPLFKNMPFNWETILFCTLASIVDCIMVILLYFSFGLIYKNSMWFRQPGILQAMFLVITGGLGAVLAEKRNLLLNNWAYSSHMPLVPVINVGLSPLLQFMLLPAFIYYVASAKVDRL